MHAALDEGITFFYNAWDYHDGRAEDLMGKALAMDGRRQKVFLMTKNCNRDYEGSLKCLEDSLRRLRTDHIDLWQFHEMVYDNDPDWVFEKGGLRAPWKAEGGPVPSSASPATSTPPSPQDARQAARLGYGPDAHQRDGFHRSFQKEVVPGAPRRVRGFGMKG
jgi:hypothetical protein